LTTASPSSPAFDLVARIAAAYARLTASSFAGPEIGLGGRLFYAGQLDEPGCAWVAAANIAGAATLAATADRTAQKQALRDGVADFLVASLDEALRILKNQLRKREAVAVCVSLAPEFVERESQERGVAPDLTRADLEAEGGAAQAALEFLTWTVASAPARWLPRIDAIAIECLEAKPDGSDWAARRWLQKAPRFVPRPAAHQRWFACDRSFAGRFIARVREAVERGQIPVAVEIHSRFAGACETAGFAPRLQITSETN
jgi:hypothetical protein